VLFYLQVTRTMRLLTSEPSVLPAIKESGAIGQLVRRRLLLLLLGTMICTVNCCSTTAHLLFTDVHHYICAYTTDHLKIHQQLRLWRCLTSMRCGMLLLLVPLGVACRCRSHLARVLVGT
jgi:ABC-type Fe3+-siderophore transport system permease subunit